MTEERPTPVERLVRAILLSAVKKSATSFTVVAEPNTERAGGYDCHVWFELEGQWLRELEPPAKLHRAVISELVRFAAIEPVPAGRCRGRFAISVAGGEQVEYQVTVTFAEPDPPFAAVELYQDA